MIVSVQDYVQPNIVKKVEIEVINYNLNTSLLWAVNFMDVDGSDFFER